MQQGACSAPTMASRLSKVIHIHVVSALRVSCGLYRDLCGDARVPPFIIVIMVMIVVIMITMIIVFISLAIFHVAYAQLRRIATNAEL